MGADLSALDAQLDELSPSAVVDVVALANDYAGALGSSLARGTASFDQLRDVDELLDQLEAQLPATSVAHGEPALASAVVRLEEPVSADTSENESIELPEPVEAEHASGELALPSRALTFDARDLADAPITTRQDIGSAAAREESAVTYARRRDDSRDITVEPDDEELAEIDEIELTPEAAPLGNVRNGLFDLNAPADAEAEQEADEAFAALFAEAARKSNPPRGEASDNETTVVAGQLANEDTVAAPANTPSIDPGQFSLSPAALPFELAGTEPVHTSAPNDGELESDLREETLDSAEFEIVNDVVTDGRPGSPSERPSRPPEKRPSFLGRLFGRKEE